jgi:hypothetical protein
MQVLTADSNIWRSALGPVVQAWDDELLFPNGAMASEAWLGNSNGWIHFLQFQSFGVSLIFRVLAVGK